MSDFLSRLIDRGGEGIAAVGPRPVALYEPAIAPGPALGFGPAMSPGEAGAESRAGSEPTNVEPRPGADERNWPGAPSSAATSAVFPLGDDRRAASSSTGDRPAPAWHDDDDGRRSERDGPTSVPNAPMRPAPTVIAPPRVPLEPGEFPTRRPEPAAVQPTPPPGAPAHALAPTGARNGDGHRSDPTPRILETVVREEVGGADGGKGDAKASASADEALRAMLRRMVLPPVRRDDARAVGAAVAEEGREAPSNGRTATRRAGEGIDGESPRSKRNGTGPSLNAPTSRGVDSSDHLALLAPRVESPAAVDAPQEAAPRTIHVRIGRIEVRATTPAAPAPAPQRPLPRPAVMSLDEFLTRGTSGRR